MALPSPTSYAKEISRRDSQDGVHFHFCNQPQEYTPQDSVAELWDQLARIAPPPFSMKRRQAVSCATEISGCCHRKIRIRCQMRASKVRSIETIYRVMAIAIKVRTLGFKGVWGQSLQLGVPPLNPVLTSRNYGYISPFCQTSTEPSLGQVGDLRVGHFYLRMD